MKIAELYEINKLLEAIRLYCKENKIWLSYTMLMKLVYQYKCQESNKGCDEDGNKYGKCQYCKEACKGYESAHKECEADHNATVGAEMKGESIFENERGN